MAILTTVFSFFTIHILVLMTSVKADPQIEVHPSEISLGLTSSLDINCSFSVTDHPEMAGFVSLILSRANSSGQTFQDLAAITEFSPDSVTLLTQEKVTATGVHSQTGQSYLHLTWGFPTDSQAGVYKCTSRGLGTLGQQIEAVNIATVTVDEANLNDIFEKLKQMEIHETAMENKMSEMENTIVGLQKHIEALEYNTSQMSSYITDQDNAIAGMEKKIQDLQNKNSQISSYIPDLQDTTTAATLQSLQLSKLALIGSYQNHDYYVSKEGFDEINKVINECKSYGGYLAEIDNENEFNAIKRFLDNTSGFCCVYIAGTDEASDGTWVFQSSNKPLPFTSWWSSGASTDTNYSCLYLSRGESWNMDDNICNIDPPDTAVRYMCEIPRV